MATAYKRSVVLSQAITAGDLATLWGLVREGHDVITECRVPLSSTAKHPGLTDSTTSEKPLLLASRSGQTAVVEYLLSVGADVNSSNSIGQTALHVVCTLNRPSVDVARLLLDSGANIDARTANQRTALLESLLSHLYHGHYHGNVELFRLLVERGSRLMESEYMCPFDLVLKKLPYSMCTRMMAAGCGWYDATPRFFLVKHLLCFYSHGDKKTNGERTALFRLLLLAGWKPPFDLSDDLRHLCSVGSAVTRAAASQALTDMGLPGSLRWLCRRVLRRTLLMAGGGRTIERTTRQLPLPTAMADFLLMVEELEQFSPPSQE